jgi:hypothetical protein
MHNPGLGGVDLFLSNERYIHPHRFADVLYISDSCRAWRDEGLLSLFSHEPPARLLLNTHPELWLGSARQSRAAFLHETLRTNTLSQHEAYLTEQIEPVWATHVGPALHDARETMR